jgi:hypothetical protein
MKRKLILIAVLLSLISVLLSACGISDDQYSAAISERDLAKTQLDSANAQLNTKMAELESTEYELRNATLKLESTESSLRDANLNVEQLRQKMIKAKVLADIVCTYNDIHFENPVINTSSGALGGFPSINPVPVELYKAIFVVYIGPVAASEDTTLNFLFMSWYESPNDFERTRQLIFYINDELPKLLTY